MEPSDEAADPTPIRALLRRLAGVHVSRGDGLTFVLLAAVAMLLMAVEALTGVLLALYYRPTTADANDSVRFVVTEVEYGGLVRSLHYWGAQSLIAVLGATVAWAGRNADEATKQRTREHLAATTLPAWAGSVEAQIGDGPFYAGERPMVVDVKLYMGMRSFRRGVMDHIPTTVFDAFPKLIRLYDAVEAWAPVKAWISR